MDLTTPLSRPGVLPGKLLRAEAVAEILDMDTHRVYALARAGTIPHVRIGRSVRYDPRAVAAWLAAGGTGPYTPPES